MRSNLLKALSCLAFLLSVQSSVSAMNVEQEIKNTKQIIANCMEQINALNKELNELAKEIDKDSYNPSFRKSNCLVKTTLFIQITTARDDIIEDLEDTNEWLKKLKQYLHF